MTVRLAAPTSVYAGAWSNNPPVATLTGTLTWTVLAGVPAGLVCFPSTAVAVSPGQMFTGTVTVTASGVGALYQARIAYYNAVGSNIGQQFDAPVMVLAGATVTLATPVMIAPALAVSVRVLLYCLDTVAVAGRVVQVTAATTTRCAEVAEIVAAPLTRPLRRTVMEVLNDDDYRVNFGTPGKLTGTITYLCDTLAAAKILDALYQTTDTLTLVTGDELNSLRHMAVGDVRWAPEKALPGKPAKWTVQVEIREVA